jgi:hypothetical protein
MHDRYLNVDDPQNPAPAGEVPADSRPPNAPEAVAPRARFEDEVRGPLEGGVRGPVESGTDRCLKVVREVLLGQPGPHSLEAAYGEVERRLKGSGP